MQTCEGCGLAYDPTAKGAGLRFCGQRCITIWANKRRGGETRQRRDRTCYKCGQTIRAANPNGRALCRACRSNTCDQCQRMFVARPGMHAHQRFCSLTCWGKWNYARRGSPTGQDHWNWKGEAAVTAKGWRGTGWSRLRQQIRERDDYTCQECGVRPEPMTVTMHNSRRGATYTYQKWPLLVHHRDGFERNDPERHAEFNDPKRLITLCISCHTRHHKTAH